MTVAHLDKDVAEMARELRELADRVDRGEITGVVFVCQDSEGEMDLEFLGDHADYAEWHTTLCVASVHFLELQREYLIPEDSDDDV